MEVSHVTPSLPQPDSAMHLSANASAEEVAESFESLFASMVIKEMRKTLSEGFFGGDKSDVLGGLFDMHLGQAIAQGGGLGIRDAFLSQIETQLEAKLKANEKNVQRFLENSDEHKS